MSLLIPLFAMDALAKKSIPQNVAYKDLKYRQVLKLSMTYQGGIISWVAFWAVYGQGFGAETLASVASFAGAYWMVVVIEPLVDLTALAAAKALPESLRGDLIDSRVYGKSF